MTPTHKGCIISLILAISVLATISLVFDSSSEGVDSPSTTQWYSYGHELEFKDRSYYLNPAKYQSITWVYSSNQLDDANHGTSKMGDASKGYSLIVNLDPGEYPYWQTKPLFVREEATMASGEVKKTEFIVNVNPISTVNYVLFMYDDTHGYKYQHISRTTSVSLGTGEFVELPKVDPSREGYTFGGWFNKDGTPFNNKVPITFSSIDDEKYVYAKWIPVGVTPPSPTIKTNFVTVPPVNGLNIEYDGMVVFGNSSFSFTVSVIDGFKFDLKDMKAITSAGRELTKTMNADGTYSFKLESVDSNTTILLTGYKQYFRIITVFDGVESKEKYEEWSTKGSILSLPLRSTTGGDVRATVYMNGADITGNSYSNGKVYIPSLQGDVMIFAYSVDKTGMMVWVFIALGAIAVTGVLGFMLYRRRHSV